VRSGGPAPSIILPTLAILPFATGPEVPDYLGLALAGELMTRLGDPDNAIASVAARDSTFTLASRRLDPCEIGAALHAEFVLTGTLYRRRKQSRVRAQLTRATDGEQLWVEDIVVEGSSIATLASELVKRVAFRLDGPGFVLPSDPDRSAPSPSLRIQSDEATDLYLRARSEWQSSERHRLQDAMALLARAVELDPSFVAARASLANLCVDQAFHGFMSPVAAAAMVRRAADGLAPAAELLSALGWISFHMDHDLAAALNAFAHPSHLPHDHSHDSWVAHARVRLAVSRHRFDEALESTRKAIELDPYSSRLHARLAWVLHLAENADASLDQIRKTLEMFPENDGILPYAVNILAHNGETAQAMELADGLATRSPHYDIAIAVQACALACAGRVDEARVSLERLQWLGRERYVLRTFNAAAYLALGEPDRAVEELRSSFENRCPWFFQMLADPRLKALSGNPEFIAMRQVLAKMESDVAAMPDQA
jgi:TolB-like protein/Flp pilus assembly protein TadD